MIRLPQTVPFSGLCCSALLLLAFMIPSHSYSMRQLVRYRVVPYVEGDGSPSETVQLIPLHSVNFHSSLKGRKSTDRLLKCNLLEQYCEKIAPKFTKVVLYKAKGDDERRAWQRISGVTPPSWKEPLANFEVLSGYARRAFIKSTEATVLADHGFIFNIDQIAAPDELALKYYSPKPDVNELRISTCFNTILKLAKTVEGEESDFSLLRTAAEKINENWGEHVIIDDLVGTPLRQINLLFVSALSNKSEPQNESLAGVSTFGYSLDMEAKATRKVVPTLVGFEYIPFDDGDSVLSPRWDLIRKKRSIIGVSVATGQEVAVDKTEEKQTIRERMKMLSSAGLQGIPPVLQLLPGPPKSSLTVWGHKEDSSDTYSPLEHDMAALQIRHKTDGGKP